MPLPISFSSLSLNDNTLKPNGSPETTQFEVAVATLTAANYVAKKALIDALNIAAVALTIGVMGKTAVTIDRQLVSDFAASSTLAQRENKYLVRYHDSVTQQKFQISIGVADLTLLPSHSENLDITTASTPGNNFKVAFEAIAVSPDDSSHSVVVDSIKFVGRNT